MPASLLLRLMSSSSVDETKRVRGFSPRFGVALEHQMLMTVQRITSTDQHD
jgi:hypothetical protein